MKAFYSDHFVLPLPKGHRFPMEKYALLRQSVQSLSDLELLEAPSATDAQLLLAHDTKYVEKIISGQLNAAEQKEIGFPWSPLMVERSKRSAGATVAACNAALMDGVSVNLAGGTHHAHRDKGSGFCVFNDVAIAAKNLQAIKGIHFRVAIIDFDVHQGNGTATIMQHNDSIFTLSIHDENNFPFNKEQSDLDIGLKNQCADSEYLNAVAYALDELEKRFSADFVIYLAGADPHTDDRLGKLSLSKKGLLLRDQAVFDFAKINGIPIAVVMAGGYGKKIEQSVEIHHQTIALAIKYSHN